METIDLYVELPASLLRRVIKDAVEEFGDLEDVGGNHSCYRITDVRTEPTTDVRILVRVTVEKQYPMTDASTEEIRRALEAEVNKTSIEIDLDA